MNKLKISTNRIEIHGSDAETYALLSNFYPISWNRKKTIATVSPRLIIEVLEIFRGITYENSDTFNIPENISKLYAKEMFARLMSDMLLRQGPDGDGVINEFLTLMPHQQLGLELARVVDRFGFFYDTRTGKTPMSLAIIDEKLRQGTESKWLVICPLILIEQAWLPDAAEFFPDMKVINCHASTPQKRLIQMKKEGQVYVTNTESFAKYKEFFDEMKFTGCFVDESSDMKSPKSKTSKAIIEFAQTMEYFYLLSGTPAPNGEWEYYTQLQAIDYYCVPSSYTQFKEKYFVNLSFNPQYEKLCLRPDGHAPLLKIVKEHSLFVDKEDVLETPGRTFHEIELEMPELLKEQYNKLKEELYLDIGETRVMAPSAAAKLNKLNQVTSGFVIDTQAIKDNKDFDEHEPEWHLLSHYRFVQLLCLLDSLKDQQAIIWCNYRKEFDIIQQMLGDQCAIVNGSVSLVEKHKAISAFKAGTVQYLIANPASADKGLTLTNAHIAIYFSLNWSYELFKQSTERIYGSIRMQPIHCDYYIFIAKGTIDRVLYSDVLQGKLVASYSILNHLKAGALL